jgi:ABC-type branched-subunit amino acid transport system ATPase component/branched-subunit amino acid ABC-type transport system permease component
VSEFFSLVVSGAVSGAIVAIVASGLVLAYTTSGIFNFSLGAVSFAAAYVFFILNTGFHWPVWISAVIAILVFSPLLGLFLDKFVLRALSRAPDVPRIIGTVGLLLAIPAILLFAVESVAINGFHVNLPLVAFATSPAGLGPTPKDTWTLFGTTTVDSNELVVLVAALISGLALWILVRHTPLGLRMRATVDKDRLAAFRGVNTTQVSVTASVLSTVLAGLAGVVAAPIIGLSPGNFNLILFVAAGAAVIGGFRSIPLAIAGGFALGVCENLFAGYAARGFLSSITGLGTALPSIVLLLGLLFLGRQRRRSAGQAVEPQPDVDVVSDFGKWRRRLPWLIAGAAVVIYTLVIANPYWQGLMIQGIALGFVFLSITLITGLGGIVSLAQGTFASASGLFVCFFFSHLGWPIIPSALVAIAIAIAMGVIVALPSVHLEGLALTLSSLALAFICSYVLFQVAILQNNGAGWTITPPHWGPLNLTDPRVMAVVYFLLLAAGCWVVGNIRRSLTGRGTLTVRASSAAAKSVGIYPTRNKLFVFALCATFAGIGGVLLALQQGQISPDSYPAATSMIWVATAVVFGVERPAGAVIAGIVTALSPGVIAEFTSSPYLPAILFGLGAIGLAQHPEGAMAQMAAQNRRRRLKKLQRLESARLAALAAGSAAPISAGEAGSASLAPISVGANRDETPAVKNGSQLPTYSPEDLCQSTVALGAGGLVAGYGEVEVLHGIDFALPAGSITILLGANGAGKSTLCATLAGAVDCREGMVAVTGSDVTKLPPHKRVAEGLSLVPESRGVFPSLTVEENLTIWLPDRQDREEVFEKFPGLAIRRRQIGWNLSGGEQQLLSLAPMIIRPPRVLIADEPTLGLAPLAVVQVLSLFQELREQGVCVLLVEEKAHAVLDIADKAALLELGRITWMGTPGQLDTSMLADAYLGATS